MLTQRQQKLQRLILAAHAQKTEWLESNIRDYRPNRDITRLSLIACLRILCGRSQSGQYYREKRKAILARICS